MKTYIYYTIAFIAFIPALILTFSFGNILLNLLGICLFLLYYILIKKTKFGKNIWKSMLIITCKIDRFLSKDI